MILVTYETSVTMCGATGAIVQPHQILRLPRKMTRMLDPRHLQCAEQRLPRKKDFIIHPRHTWNSIYNARSKWCHPPTSPNMKSDTATSPNSALATKSDTWISLESCSCHEIDDSYYLTLLLLDDSYCLMTPVTWRFLLLDGSYFWTLYCY